MKVHRIELMIVDCDELGVDEIKEVIENQRYPNRCINPYVMEATTVEVEWTDRHPLNLVSEMDAEYHRLFAKQ